MIAGGAGLLKNIQDPYSNGGGYDNSLILSQTINQIEAGRNNSSDFMEEKQIGLLLHPESSSLISVVKPFSTVSNKLASTSLHNSVTPLRGQKLDFHVPNTGLIKDGETNFVSYFLLFQRVKKSKMYTRCSQHSIFRRNFRFPNPKTGFL